MKRDEDLPDWDRLLSAGARLQQIVPGAVLVGGTAAAMVAHHRFSYDADHVVEDLRTRFDGVLADLEEVAGWKTARVNRPVLILENLDGIETGIRQLIRTEPLETQQIPSGKPGSPTVVIPTPGEILRIKAALILKRNATRDYVDVAALSKQLGRSKAVSALSRLDELYPQPNGQSATQQLLVQLNDARPHDLDKTALAHYKGLRREWHAWSAVQAELRFLAGSLFHSQLNPTHSQESAAEVSKAPPQRTAVPTDHEIRELTSQVTSIGEGRAKGKIRFNWEHLDEDERDARLAFLDQSPDAFKAALEAVWRERDPQGFKAWEDRGRTPSPSAKAKPIDRSRGRD